RQELHVRIPTAEEVRRRASVKAVSVVLQVLPEVVRVVAQAEDAGAARDVGAGNDPVAWPQRPPFAVGYRIRAADGLDDSHVLVAADERVDDVALVVRSGVLLRLAAVSVLVRAA